MQRIVLSAIVAAVLFGSALYFAAEADQAPTPPNPPPSAQTSSPDDPGPDEPTADSEPSPDPTTSATDPGVLSLEAATSHGRLPIGEEKRLYASIDITAGEGDTGARPPLNVALVVDRSGSMRGRKLRQARKAAHTIVDMLQPRDKLTLVSYGSEAKLVSRPAPAKGAAIERMHEAIRTIHAGGGTHIEGGVRRARRALASAKTERSINRVVMLSDGKPTVGRTSVGGLGHLAERINGQGVSLTAMGVGVDYNEEVLMQMANAGGGNYYFIDAPAKVVSMFEKELGTLAETVARNVSLVVDFGDNIELVDSHGPGGEYGEGRARIGLSEFSAGQTKSVLLELTGRLAGTELERVLEVDLSYRDVGGEVPAHQGLALTAAGSSTSAAIEASVDEGVISRVQQLEVASTLDQAIEAFEQGDKGRARQVLDRRRDQLEQRHAEYELPEETMQKADRKLKDTRAKIQKRAVGSTAGREAVKEEKAESNMIKMDRSSY